MADTRYTLGIAVHPRADVSESVRTLLDWSGRHPADVVAVGPSAQRMSGQLPVLPDEEVAQVCDGIVSLGGDGTMLGAMRMVVGRDIPVLGVNHGHLGFLVEVQPRELSAALDRLVAGDFSVEPHDCLRVRLPDGGTASAFNDTVLARAGTAGATVLDLALGEVHYGYYRADALVVATPAGSTAYSYAAGGPVVSPGCEAMVVTPVAPMSGISRALVLASREPVTLTLTAASAPTVLLADGVEHGRLEPGAALRIDVLHDAGKVVRIDAAGHAARSRVKLSLLDLPLEQDQLQELVPAHLRHRRTSRS